MSLQEVLVECFERAFDAITSDYDPHDIAGLGAFTDHDASSIVFVAHSREHERSQINEAPEYASDAVWNLFDWDLPLGGNELLSDAESRANEAIAELDDTDIVAHRTLVWCAAVNAMVSLVDRGCFERWPDAVRVFMVADGINDDEQFDWNVRLNGPDRVTELRGFFFA